MKPASVPIAVEIYAGDDVTFPGFVIKDSLGSPIDLSSYTGWAAEWRKRATDTTPLSLTVDATQANVGRLQLSADSETTRAMGASGVWDVQATSATGDTQTFLYGTTRWREDVTRG